LVVVFPGGNLRLGDIAPGVMSKYVNVPSGVYRYAALRHSWDGRPITQSVTDSRGMPIATFVVTDSSFDPNLTATAV